MKKHIGNYGVTGRGKPTSLHDGGIRRNGSKQYLGDVKPLANPTLSVSAMWGLLTLTHSNLGEVLAVDTHK